MIKTMAELIFNAAFNMLSIYVSIRVIRLFLKEKSGVKILSFFVYGAFWIQNYLVYYFVRQWYWVTLSFIIGAFLMSCILLKGNIGQKNNCCMSCVGTGDVGGRSGLVCLKTSASIEEQ